MIAENIARTDQGPREVVRIWLSSPNHRANIENCRFTHQGMGLRDGRWTHVFYAP